MPPRVGWPRGRLDREGIGEGEEIRPLVDIGQGREFARATPPNVRRRKHLWILTTRCGRASGEDRPRAREDSGLPPPGVGEECPKIEGAARDADEAKPAVGRLAERAPALTDRLGSFEDPRGIEMGRVRPDRDRSDDRTPALPRAQTDLRSRETAAQACSERTFPLRSVAKGGQFAEEVSGRGPEGREVGAIADEDERDSGERAEPLDRIPEERRGHLRRARLAHGRGESRLHRPGDRRLRDLKERDERGRPGTGTRIVRGRSIFNHHKCFGRESARGFG